MKPEYPYILEPQEGGGFVVQFLDIEEAFTEGATPEECAFNAVEVLTGILEQRLEDGVEIPLPSQLAQRPVAPRRRFVPAVAVALFGNAPAIDADRFRADLDAWADQDPLPRA